MDQSNDTRKSKTISFRLTREEYDVVERAALAAGDETNSWCRKIALLQLTEGFGFTKKERVLYEEIARVRYLVGSGFRILLSSQETTAANWKTITAQVEQKSDLIADDLLSRRK
jgi:hypothetical protein